MTPLQDITFAAPLTPEQRNNLFYEFHNRPIFQAVLEYLREEAFIALGKSMMIRNGIPDDSGKVPVGNPDLLLGSFDALSQVTAKLKALGDIAPPIEE